MARSLAETYRREGVLPATGCPPAGAVLVRADGQDQRTRASGQAAADALAPGCGLQVRSGPEGEADPLFDSLPLCPLDEAEVRAGVLAAAGQGGLVAPAARRALERLQAVAAPDGCAGEGPCLSAPTRLVVKPSGARLEGGLGEGATLGEIFLLEYAEGLPLPQVAWGAAVDPAFFEAVLAAHEREAALTRRVLPVAAHRGLLLARAVVRALHGLSEDGRPDGPKLVLFAGHDTNLSNLAGIFGLDWTLEGQPDATAPATALAFELWREPESGRATVRAVVYYETLDQLRTLQPQRAQAKALDLGICAGAQACTIAAVESALAARLPKVCPATAGAR
jgi:4-phytase/acid phosphatase